MSRVVVFGFVCCGFVVLLVLVFRVCWLTGFAAFVFGYFEFGLLLLVGFVCGYLVVCFRWVVGWLVVTLMLWVCYMCLCFACFVLICVC